MEPSGDVAYVTCGPFECVDGMESAGALDRELRGLHRVGSPDGGAQVGKVDNDVDGRKPRRSPWTPREKTASTSTTTGNDGLDIGIVTSSTVAR